MEIFAVVCSIIASALSIFAIGTSVSIKKTIDRTTQNVRTSQKIKGNNNVQKNSNVPDNA